MNESAAIEAQVKCGHSVFGLFAKAAMISLTPSTVDTDAENCVKIDAKAASVLEIRFVFLQVWAASCEMGDRV